MSGGNRLAPQGGEFIDRSRPISFSFAGETFVGCAGDTIASALAANNKWILSRSFKYRRPRGVLTMAGQDANTLVQLPDEPNALADRHPVSDGLRVEGQNFNGSLEDDRGALIGPFGKFLPVGFYYKSFFRPAGAWKFWEPIIRRRAGLGEINKAAHHGYFDKAYHWCDVAVIGGGPAGMAAALRAARAGAEVLLIDENPRLGGSLSYARFDAEGESAAKTLSELAGAIAQESSVTVMTDATCTGLFDDNWLSVIKGDRLYKVRAKEVVLATGSIEQPLVFRNNDLPGIMQASAALRLIRQYAVRPGRRAVVAAANSDGYAAALELLRAGVEVAAIVDLRPSAPRDALSDAVRDHNVRVLEGFTAYEAIGESGNRHVRGVVAAKIDGRGKTDGATASFDCDLVLMATGFTPTHQLLSQAGGAVAYDSATAMFAVQSVPKGVSVAGSLNGSYSPAAVIAEGDAAGHAAAKALGLNAGAAPSIPNDRGNLGQSHPWPIFPHPSGKDFVDFDEDLQVADIVNSVREGYDHIELVKRYSTVGMGPSQGRHSSVNAARLTAEANGLQPEAVGHTTARPPFSAEKMGLLAGRAFEPVRLTAMHHRHLEAGAQMMPAGLWLRPAYYGPRSERARLIREEALNVRNNVGIIDVSTLGGIDVCGPDAAEFLERLYTFAYKKQEIGRSRYVLMTDETGVIVDDGVACRLHEHHFYVTATTSGVDSVYRGMLLDNAQWRLDVVVTNVTAAYAGVNIAGPRSREVLSRLTDLDLSREAFPYLGVRLGKVAGIPARIMRVGFVGELGYEIHVPSSMGEALWDALIAAGRPDGIRPFGVEAQRLLRLEKGHIIVSQDTDGLTNPIEADMAWAISRRKPFFVGGRSIDIQEKNGISRKLVGFVVDDPSGPVPEECHLTLKEGAIAGRVTSAARSETLNQTIGLAYVLPEQSAVDTLFDIKIGGGRIIKGRVVKLPFYDPAGARQEM
jgi:sarcosine oxidase subunit alpha